MVNGGEPAVVSDIRAVLEASPLVRSVRLGGSRADGRATELSDWDLYLGGDPETLMDAVPELVAPRRPLAAFWEPLSEQAGYMMVMDGPVKIDLFPVGGCRRLQPPWQVDADTLPRIDAHFWDWSLWLGGKSLRREHELIRDELTKMRWFLLAPLGVTDAPKGVDDAVRLYRRARTTQGQRFDVVIDDELGRQVSGALRRHGLIS